MTAADFASFYQAVHGFPPFAWQVRLLETVVNEGWPSTIALPTSSGKTSAIDIAVFHLALESGRAAVERGAPLRIFFVIDRRVVVDEAAEHALVVAKALVSSKSGIVQEVGDALKRFGAGLPLDVAVLRGGMCRDSTWADEPNQPLVCVSTVDQVGSRLLFRGYQVSDASKPVHAALVGNDSLIIVDEAHLSAPFLDTLVSVQRQRRGEFVMSLGVKVVRMSATIAADERFELGDADCEDLVLRKRLWASKPAELRVPAKGFEDELVRAAKELALGKPVSVVGVVVNTVAAARAVFEGLRKLKDGTAILLTGRNRAYCSQRLWDEYKDRIAAKADRPEGERLFVVATQTVEVGANIDFDALVSESAPLDALRQRFGRLNRLGNRAEARAVIVRRPKEDPVYGEATARTWEFLLSLGEVDFGVSAMSRALAGRDQSEFATRSERGPIAFAKYFEMWAQTNPAPDPDPDVAPFLHGKDALEDADVQVVWREDLKEDADSRDWQQAVELAPPVSSEGLPIPIGAVKRWLRGETKLEVSDIEGASMGEEDTRKEAKRVLIWRGKAEDKPLTDLRRVRPGDVVVVPAAYGGCDRFGWHPGSRELVTDIGDEANNELAFAGLRGYRVRLELFGDRLGAEDRSKFRELVTSFRSALEDGDSGSEIKDKIGEFFASFSFPGEMRIDSSLHVATWPRHRPKQTEIRAALKPEDQEDDSVGLQREVTLRCHTEGVVKRTREYATRCGLSGAMVDDLVLAAELHDLGKWDERFQAWLCRGSAALAARLSEPLAKSGGRQTLHERRLAQELAKYPDGARHESASVLLACVSAEMEQAHDPELVLHLIGSHHGYGRPLVPHWEEDDDTSVLARRGSKVLESGTGRSLARLDSGWTERFSRLNERYGYWGLAYLETILRRADCVQSREEQA
jgi:CRISPR-associated endonuclease/helicase Cas3